MRPRSQRGGRRHERGPRRDRPPEHASSARAEDSFAEGGTGVAPDLSELVRYLASQLTDYPDAVEVSVQEGPQTLYELRVASEDQGRVIGREGRTIQALRVLVGAAARRHGGRATVELLEE